MYTTSPRPAIDSSVASSGNSRRIGRSLQHILGLRTAAWLLLILSASVAHTNETNAVERPNIVVILIDDLGWRDLGCFGSTLYHTPHIDRLASEGVRFTNAYAGAAICTPSRASILTGKTPARLGITQYYYGKSKADRKLLEPDYVRQLPQSETTLAEALKAHGYQTWAVGKWHLGTEGSMPKDHGFDVNVLAGNLGPPRSYFSPYRNLALHNGPEGEHLPERLSREAARLIQKRDDRPFFLYYALHSVHRPIQPRPDLAAKYKAILKTRTIKQPNQYMDHGYPLKRVQDNPDFAAMVEAMDQSVGNVINTLRSEGLYDNTAIFFYSDNGGLAGTRTRPRLSPSQTSIHPLRLGKHWLYEGGVRVPAIIRFPGITRPGTEIETPIIHMDLYPTILDVAELPLLPKQHVDGVSLRSLLAQESQALERDGAFFWHAPHYSSSPPCSAVRKGDYKLLRFYEDGGTHELYNLKTDIGERNNLATTLPEKTKELQSLLDQWIEETGALLPVPNPGNRK